MNNTFRERLIMLTEPWCATDFISELLGIDVTEDDMAAKFRAWSSRFLTVGQVERDNCKQKEVHRHAFETFLLQNRLLSWKWAAISLGMSTAALKEVVNGFEARGMPLDLNSSVSPQLVRRRESNLLFRAFPNLRNRTFSDHSKMCKALHQAIRADLGIEVEPKFCVTSLALEQEEPDFAVAFDAITFEPVGLRYQVWLETNKPADLRPDVCSLKFYARNEPDLRDWVMKGSVPRLIDKRLRSS